jgi:hypothetical protein
MKVDPRAASVVFFLFFILMAGLLSLHFSRPTEFVLLAEDVQPVPARSGRGGIGMHVAPAPSSAPLAARPEGISTTP